MATSENDLADNHSTANDSATSAPNSRTADRDIEAILQGLRLTEDVTNGPTNAPTTKDQMDTDTSPNVFQVLPPELMAEIFTTVCHADSDKFLSDKQRHKRTTPLILSHVCTAWRTLIHSTPLIWSHVCLCLSRGRLSSQIDLLLDWLIRSGACPLNISLCFENEDDWEGGETVPQELVNLLGSAASRWRSLNVVLPEGWYAFFVPYLEPPDGCSTFLPLLTALTTQPLWTDCGQAPTRRKPLTLFRHAPLLSDLHLNGYYLVDVSMPWPQLTSLTLQHVYLDECFYALSRTPNLTYCRLYTILENNVEREVQETEVRLDELERLIMFGALWHDTVPLLRNLRTPKLCSVEISAPQDGMFVGELGRLLQRKMRCTGLRRLALTDMFVVVEDAIKEVQEDGETQEPSTPKGLRPYEFREALGSFDTLEELVLELKSASAPLQGCFLLDLLGTADSSDPAVLPHLKKFTFSGHLLFADLVVSVPSTPPPPRAFKSVFPSPPPISSAEHSSSASTAPSSTIQNTQFLDSLLSALEFRTDPLSVTEGHLKATLETLELRTDSEEYLLVLGEHRSGREVIGQIVSRSGRRLALEVASTEQR